MSAILKRQRPVGAGRVCRNRIEYGSKPTTSGRLPDNWRSRLPDPASYYSAHVAKLGKPNGSGWTRGRCPFHDDSEASLSVHLTGERGGWRCFAGCGAGDLAAFHSRLTGKTFAESVRDLIGLRGVA